MILIWKALKSKIKPKILYSISDPIVFSIINICISSEKNRPSARELLNHEFFQPNKDDNFPVVLIDGEELNTSNINEIEEIQSDASDECYEYDETCSDKSETDEIYKVPESNQLKLPPNPEIKRSRSKGLKNKIKKENIEKEAHFLEANILSNWI